MPETWVSAHSIIFQPHRVDGGWIQITLSGLQPELLSGLQLAIDYGDGGRVSVDTEISYPGWLSGIAGAFGALVTLSMALKKFISISFITRTEHDAAMSSIREEQLQFNAQLRNEQRQMHAEWRDEQRQMHAQNIELMNRIHERVDALWERRRYPRGDI